MWFTFRQYFSFAKYMKPADYVVVEAESCEDANQKVLRHGVYFDGVAKGLDCDCCEDDRWSRVENSDGTDQPLIDGKPIVEHKPGWLEGGRRITALIIPTEGKSKTIIVGTGGL